MITPFKLHQEIINIIGNYDIIKNYREGSKRTGVWEIQCKSDLKSILSNLLHERIDGILKYLHTRIGFQKFFLMPQN